MFERFTDRARRVVVLAQDEARELGHDHISTEHLLLALVDEGGGVAARALELLGITKEDVQRKVEELTGRGRQPTPLSHIPFTQQAKSTLQLALREALHLGHDYIGTEHILLGLLREGGVAAQVLVSQGAELTLVRRHVIELLRAHQGKSQPGTASAGQAPG